MKNTIIAIVVVLVLGFGIYYLINSSNKVAVVNEQNISTSTLPVATTTPSNKAEEIIGRSVEGRDIVAYHYQSALATSTDSKEVLFIGGIHGGYEWNTVSVAYGVMDYLKATPSVIPNNVKVTVIPVMNPDGLNKVVGTSSRFFLSDVPSTLADTVPGRFNANTVDLNRNFDCDWQTTGTWQNKNVSGGTATFSEPESQAIRNYVETNKPAAVIVWYSAAGGVFSSSCHNGISTVTRALTNAFAKASGYTANEEFDFYETTGDMTNWLAKIDVPAISILLTNHTDVELSKNKAGVEAVLKYLAK